MPRFSPGCNCCDTPSGSFFGATGDANAIMYAPPCPPSNRLGIEITIANAVDCSDDDGSGFFESDCGDCNLTLSNLNGTYYCPYQDTGATYELYTFGPITSGTCTNDAACFDLDEKNYLTIAIRWLCTTALEANDTILLLTDVDGNPVSGTIPVTALNFRQFTEAQVLAGTTLSGTVQPGCCVTSSFPNCTNGIQPNPPGADVTAEYVTT